MIDTTEIFPWNVNFMTGIAVIDQQHQRLVYLINKLAIHMVSDDKDFTPDQVLDELTEYTIYHFKTEEAVWRKYLPDDALEIEHRHKHQALIDEIVLLRNRQTGGINRSEFFEEMLSYLTHWLAFHILDNDRYMANIIAGIQQGMTLNDAKAFASSEMDGVTKVLIEAVLKMYESLSTRTLTLMREVTMRQRAEQKLGLSKKAIDSSMEAIFITDAAGVLIDANPAFCVSAGDSYEQLVGMNIDQVRQGIFERSLSHHIWDAARLKGHWAGEILADDMAGNSDPVWLTLSAVKDDDAKLSHYVGVVSSASLLIQHRQALEVELNHDMLTGLPNRRLLADRLTQAIALCARNEKKLAVCFVDLDGFKAVNDTLGHDAGDALLCTLADRMQQQMRGGDSVARLGGDEFVVLLADVSCADEINVPLERLITLISKPVQFGAETAVVSASIGVAQYPDHGTEPDTLLKRADQAMYGAKQAGKSRYHIWQE
ncbi:MAG: bacteriohemerythrin [Mariprofundus sp.]